MPQPGVRLMVIITSCRYVGEVRSPLRQQQNVIATVQRSKSAQTPNPKPTVLKKTSKASETETAVSSPSVSRSRSLRSAADNELKVPEPLRETIYDNSKTPKSDRVKRHLSDRIVTPKGVKNESRPFIKAALNNARTPGRALGPVGSPAFNNSPRI